MKLTINGVTVSLDNTPKEIIINGNDVFASIINNSNEDVRVSEYTIDNPKLVEYYYEFEGLETFTGVVKDSNHDIAYYVNGELHRDDGPAIECYHGDTSWFSYGKYHRTDGPAFESIDEDLREWYFNDKCYGTNDDFTKESWIAFVATLK